DIEKGVSLLTECADGGDAFSCYKLGNLYLKGEIINQDLDKAEKYLLSAEDNEFMQYALGKIYLQKEKYDIQKAISYFEKSANKNMWASYQLGKIYLFGTDGLKKEKAMQFLNLSAEQGNEYAQNILNNQEKFENEILASTIFSLFINLSRCIEDDYHNKFKSGRKMIDSKLRRMIQEKNQALGIKQEHGQTQEY
ncbi:MAG: sel1 repeat family protein, partial [Ruminococcus sp.]|nr:sel1 repeat family protein [Ruminococcus sp.]